MKTLLLLLSLQFTLYNTCFSQNVLATCKTPDLVPEQIPEFDPAISEYLIKVICSSSTEASTMLTTLKLSFDPDHPANKDLLIAPVSDTSDNKVLLFKVTKDKLSLQLVKVAFILSGASKSQFKLKQKENAKDSDGKIALIPKATDDAQIKQLTEIIFGTKPDEGAIPEQYKNLYSTTISNNLIYDIQKNELKAKLTAGEIKKASKSGSDAEKQAAKEKAARKHRVKVGSSLMLELNPVPNPYKFNVSIISDYVNNNDSSTNILDKYLLNPFGNISEVDAKSGGTDEIRKKMVLGYLQVVNSAVIKFLNYYRDDLQFIDRPTFETDKKNLQTKIDEVLAKDDLHYPGNMQDFILNEFSSDDSIRVAGILKNYTEFQRFTIPQTFLPIAKVSNYDELGITVKAIPKANQFTGLHLDTITNRIPITVYRGIKVDVSTGLFYSGLDQPRYAILRDSTLVTSSTGIDSVTSRSAKIIKENGNYGRVGFASMIHFYSRWGTNVNVSLSFGAGITFMENPQLRYLIGGSILLGRTNRIALTGGYSFGRIDDLSDTYRVAGKDDEYKPLNPTSTDLTMKKVMKGSAFFAVSYNFPLLKRKN